MVVTILVTIHHCCRGSVDGLSSAQAVFVFYIVSVAWKVYDLTFLPLCNFNINIDL